MRIRSVFFIGLLLACPAFIFAQQKITGIVLSEDGSSPLAGAHLSIKSTQQVAVTRKDGAFEINNLEAKTYQVVVQHLGYEKEAFLLATGKNHMLHLSPTIVSSDAVVITGTRTRKRVGSSPGRTEWLSSSMLKSLPAQELDGYLDAMPGVMINRDHGIFSHSSSVSMRGLGGDQQGRYLIMIDGAPMNKADGGSVNWNSINPLSIRQIEIAKGPMSSLYGGNAMGGAVNMIERQPTKNIQADVLAEYGSLNTKKIAAWAGGAMNPGGNGLYWAVDGFYNNSDGFIYTPEDERDTTDVASWMKEYSAKARLGYRINKNHTLELSSRLWDDMRGSGTKIYSETGTYFGHNVWRSNFNYRMNYEKLNVLVNLYNSDEGYIRLNESIKLSNDQISYTAYDVTSSRIDRGGNVHGDYTLGFQTLSAGLESKQGSVYGEDIYNTSTDIVTNQGKMNTASAYLQDDISLMSGKLNFVLGLRYDRAQFFDGAFTLTEPTNATSILADLENSDLADYTWGAVSPKAAAKYNFTDQTSAYVSYGYGFRPSILDDLCRSGFVRGGFKKANPNLEPERVNNLEAGMDIGIGDHVKITGSGYYTQGEDFIYLVSNGEFIAMGSKQRPVKEARNISSVETYGAEIGAWASLPNNLTAWLSYAYNHSEILDFDDEDGQDLIGKSLIYNPAHMLKSGLVWNNPIVNFSLQANWLSKQWMDDMNEEEIPAHMKVHAKIWKQFRAFEVFVKGNNLTNVVYVEGHGQLSLGRFITSGIQIHF